MTKEEKGKFIYWKRKDSDTWSRSYVMDAIDTNEGLLLELCDNTWGTAYPLRILEKDIDILTEIKTKK